MPHFLALPSLDAPAALYPTDYDIVLELLEAMPTVIAGKMTSSDTMPKASLGTRLGVVEHAANPISAKATLTLRMTSFRDILNIECATNVRYGANPRQPDWKDGDAVRRSAMRLHAAATQAITSLRECAAPPKAQAERKALTQSLQERLMGIAAYIAAHSSAIDPSLGITVVAPSPWSPEPHIDARDKFGDQVSLDAVMPAADRDAVFAEVERCALVTFIPPSVLLVDDGYEGQDRWTLRIQPLFITLNRELDPVEMLRLLNQLPPLPSAPDWVV